MAVLDELTTQLSGPSRTIVIAEKEVNLRPGASDNTLFLLKVGEGSLAAGGRGGGFGERRVTNVLCFEVKKGVWSKKYESESEGQAAEFEVPYYVSRLPLTMPDGTETMGYGVVEPELIGEMAKKAGILFSA